MFIPCASIGNEFMKNAYFCVCGLAAPPPPLLSARRRCFRCYPLPAAAVAATRRLPIAAGHHYVGSWLAATAALRPATHHPEGAIYACIDMSQRVAGGCCMTGGTSEQKLNEIALPA
jgi:hypothetical protein